jgi:glycosyltransferase involved in cell wall biosynthesis
MNAAATQPRNAAALMLSVIIPVFNEEILLADAVRRLRRRLDERHVAAEIIMVDDGSHDRSGEIADGLARELPGVAVCHQPNQGIGGAFRTGAARARGDYLMLWPVDLPADAADLDPYVRYLGRVDVIVGCRRRRVGYSLLMRWNAWLYRRLADWLFNLRFRDVNWIHVYRREYFQRIVLTQRGIPMLVEALVRLRDAGASFAEVEVEMKRRQGGVSSASRLSVMWRTLAGLFSFWLIWRREKRRPASPQPPSA